MISPFGHLICILITCIQIPPSIFDSGEIACDPIFNFLQTSADLVPQFNGSTCILFDEDAFHGNELSEEKRQEVEKFCDPREVRQ